MCVGRSRGVLLLRVATCGGSGRRLTKDRRARVGVSCAALQVVNAVPGAVPVMLMNWRQDDRQRQADCSKR
jgi:hypothetical protein